MRPMQVGGARPASGEGRPGGGAQPCGGGGPRRLAKPDSCLPPFWRCAVPGALDLTLPRRNRPAWTAVGPSGVLRCSHIEPANNVRADSQGFENLFVETTPSAAQYYSDCGKGEGRRLDHTLPPLHPPLPRGADLMGPAAVAVHFKWHFQDGCQSASGVFRIESVFGPRGLG